MTKTSLQTHSGIRSMGLLAATMASSLFAAATHAQWPQFGGPNRDFKARGGKLAEKWPEAGPRRIWKRALGDGYSTITVDDGRLYTMCRKPGEDGKPGPQEYVVCLDARTGQTVWEHKYDAPALENQTDRFGWGPNPTPLVVGDRIFTAGYTAKMHCLDKKTGSPLWSHDLVQEFGCKPGRFGFSISPTAYKDTVIMLVGGEGQTFVAFNRSGGSVAWKAQSFDVGHSSPILTEFNGKEMLVACVVEEVAGDDPTNRGLPKMVGVDPNNGKLLWEHPMPRASTMASPIWGDDHVIFTSSAYESGSRAIKLSEADDKITPEELWYTRKIRVHFGSSIRLGDYVYASSGQDGPAFLSCINVHTGKVKWRERGFAKSSLCYADDKIIFLDEDGQLGLAKVSPEGMDVLSQCRISEARCWSAPTIVGTTMYVRDRQDIMALDLSAGSGEAT